MLVLCHTSLWNFRFPAVPVGTISESEWQKAQRFNFQTLPAFLPESRQNNFHLQLWMFNTSMRPCYLTSFCFPFNWEQKRHAVHIRRCSVRALSDICTKSTFECVLISETDIMCVWRGICETGSWSVPLEGGLGKCQFYLWPWREAARSVQAAIENSQDSTKRRKLIEESLNPLVITSTDMSPVSLWGAHTCGFLNISILSGILHTQIND